MIENNQIKLKTNHDHHQQAVNNNKTIMAANNILIRVNKKIIFCLGFCNTFFYAVIIIDHRLIYCSTGARQATQLTCYGE